MQFFLWHSLSSPIVYAKQVWLGEVDASSGICSGLLRRVLVCSEQDHLDLSSVNSVF